MTKLDRFAALSAPDKQLLIHAWLLLAYMRAAILCTSFKKLTRALQHYRDVPTCSPVTSGQLEQARNIGRLVAKAARHTPWQSRCLVQVLVVQRLLAGRHIAGQFYLGVLKGRYDGSTELAAHAWVHCGDVIVNGARGHEQFTIVSTFSWSGVDD